MSTRALVLGGGGLTGIAWEIGVLAALARAGLDLAGADVVIGTSAGSVVGAQCTSGRTPEQLYAEQFDPVDEAVGASFSTSTMVRLLLPMVLPGHPLARRRRIGRAALRAHPEPADERIALIRANLGVDAWPDRDLRITAVDAGTGRSRVFDRDSGVDLVSAVAASCAVPLVWPPVEIDGSRYVDGGMRSPVNADLARGADRVVVLAPLPRSFSKYTSARAQVRRLGPDTRWCLISPDRPALAAIGQDMLDVTRRPESARSGLRQGAAIAEAVRAGWE